MRRNGGFTLIELLVTIVVLAVVMTVAIPNYRDYILQSRVKTGAQELFLSLLYARSEAVKSNAPVHVTPADPNAWEQGWIITDVPARTYDECEGGASNCLRIQQPLTDVEIDSDDVEVVYQGNGRTTDTARFGFCTPDGGAAITQRVVATDLTGRPSIEYDGACP